MKVRANSTSLPRPMTEPEYPSFGQWHQAIPRGRLANWNWRRHVWGMAVHDRDIQAHVRFLLLGDYRRDLGLGSFINPSAAAVDELLQYVVDEDGCPPPERWAAMKGHRP